MIKGLLFRCKNMSSLFLSSERLRGKKEIESKNLHKSRRI